MTLRSQDAQPGDLFAALPGASSHGGRYAADAVARGAVAVLTDAGRCGPHGRRRRRCRCWSARPAVGARRAGRRRVRQSVASTLRVIGVTGTSGKTTTTYLVEAGLRAAERVAGLIGTVGIRIDGRTCRAR